jgi:hypothetical protein
MSEKSKYYNKTATNNIMSFKLIIAKRQSASYQIFSNGILKIQYNLGFVIGICNLKFEL